MCAHIVEHVILSGFVNVGLLENAIVEGNGRIVVDQLQEFDVGQCGGRFEGTSFGLPKETGHNDGAFGDGLAGRFFGKVTRFLNVLGDEFFDGIRSGFVGFKDDCVSDGIGFDVVVGETFSMCVCVCVGG